MAIFNSYLKLLEGRGQTISFHSRLALFMVYIDLPEGKRFSWLDLVGSGWWFQILVEFAKRTGS